MLLPVPFSTMRCEHSAQALADLPEPTVVPTMGALHEGHLSLVRQARALGNPVIVSLFVNPTQFAPNEDFATYPRTLEKDAALAEAAGATALYLPSAEEVYPHGLAHATRDAAAFALPSVASTPQLEDFARPQFFGGVCLVVARLFDLIKPSAAVFGEKDWQQLKTIEAMVAQTPRFQAISIHAGAIVREQDGLAMSSRNAALHASDRHAALALVEAINTPTNETSMRQRLTDRGLEVDYAVIRDAATLLAPRANHPTRALIAARLNGPNGPLRLIDNGPAAIS